MNEETSRFSLLEVDDAPAALPAGPSPDAREAIANGLCAFAEWCAALPPPALKFDITPPASFRPVTAHGAQMSPRMARCYGWLAKCSIPISDFSTDDGVQACLPQLQAQIATLKAAINRKDVFASLVNGVLTAEGAHVGPELLQDLEGLARRTPENRVQATGTADQAEAKPAIQDQLTIVSQADETTGAVVYWRLSGDIKLADLEKAWAAEGRKADRCIRQTSPDVALARACKKLASPSVMVRKHPKGGWAVVREVKANNDLSYEVGARFYLAKPATEGAEPAVSFEGDNGETARVEGNYRYFRDNVVAEDVSSWLVALAHQLKAVALRDLGGIYFVPRDSVKGYESVKRALGACSSHRLYQLPALRSSDTVQAVVDGLATEVELALATVVSEIEAKAIGARAAATRSAELALLVRKIESYELLLGNKMDGAKAQIKAVQDKLGKVTSRVAQLEID